MSSDMLAGARLLIVDDDESVARLVARIVERAGHHPQTVEDAARARAALAADSFDLVVCDVQMPGESGIQLARHIAVDHADTAVLMISGIDDPAIAESALDVGAYGYMVKPVARNEVLIGVANALRRLSLERENRMVMASLEERQALLERLSRIQRSISHRAELQTVLDAIVDGAHELLGEEIAALRTIDPQDHETMVIVASRGITEAELAATSRVRLGEGADGRALADGGLVVIGRETQADGLTALAGPGASAAMSAPVRQGGELVGSLVVASAEPGRVFTSHEQDMLLAFAEHASLALTDARMLEQMHDALHDPLTGLPNRSLFIDRLESAIRDAEPDTADPAVLLVDLDRFGVVNETLGHEVGDALLAAVVERLEATVHPSDTVARLGGSDFAILLQDVDGRNDPEAVAERLLEAFNSPVELAGRELAVNVSIGLSSGRGDARELLREADVAMYRARREGKGRYQRFSAGMKLGLLQHLEFEADLQRAVERGEFAVHYQPIIGLAGQQLIGFEALVRWQHPRRGLIPPLMFIPLAEEMGRIHAIGRTVLREACRQAARWHDAYPTDPGLCINVNLSVRQLERPELIDDVRSALREFEVEPSRLVLEITESILMQDSEVTADALTELKKLGVQLAIDDFGTGYSSLHYIRRFPLDILKIAKPFVDGLARTREDGALVQTILDLARNFGLKVVAEGVETLRQAVELNRLACDYAQGYHFSRPVDAEGAAQMLVRAGRGYGHLGSSASQDFVLPPPLRAAGLAARAQ